jgi:diadenosine tetraphosphate (Ap4A) HIT family hydrolase
MLIGPATRRRNSQKRYNSHLKRTKKNACEFCAFTAKSSQVIEDFSSFWVVRNIFGYDIWDGCGVEDHLMVVPKRHVDSISHFMNKEMLEYAKLLQKYESKGYSIYSRAAENITKSIPHQHTHFIKLDNKRKKALFYLRKPHTMVYI